MDSFYTCSENKKTARVSDVLLTLYSTESVCVQFNVQWLQSEYIIICFFPIISKIGKVLCFNTSHGILLKMEETICTFTKVLLDG